MISHDAVLNTSYTSWDALPAVNKLRLAAQAMPSSGTC